MRTMTHREMRVWQSAAKQWTLKSSRRITFTRMRIFPSNTLQ